MLVLSRRGGEEIQIGSHVTVLVVKIGRGKVRIGIAAPKEIPVHRAEIAAKLSAEEVSRPFKEAVYDRLF
ncbi:MAG: carbon storage regulator [Pirellulales bacterium]